MKKYLIVDSHALIHRAYHSYPPTLTLPDGTPINAVYGFLSLLITAIEKTKPDYVICAFDTPTPTFRHIEFVDYKAHRKPIDEDLKIQFPLCREVVEAFDIPIVFVDGYEADDVIGTLVHRYNEINQVIILTGDSDQYQLVKKNINIYMAGRSFKDSKLMDEKQVAEKLGFAPINLIDYKAIRGDTSDNIPGIKGIGEKVATELIQKYSTLENIYKNIDKIEKIAVQQKLLDNYEIAVTSKKLATIDVHVPIAELEIKGLFRNFDKDKVSEKLSKFQFRSLRDRVQKLTFDANESKESKKDIKSNKKSSQKSLLLEKDIVIKDNINIGFDIKSYAHQKDKSLINHEFFDLEIVEFLLNYGNRVYPPEVSEYIKLFDKYTVELDQNESLKKYYYEIEVPVIKILFDMEEHGINVSIDKLTKAGETLDNEIEKVTSKIYELIGHEFNIASPKQVGEVLAEEQRIPLKKNKLGNYQTGEAELVKFAKSFEVIDCILKFREFSKLKNTYVESLIELVKNGKIHTTYHLATASTGRLSSKDPNLQNIPKGTDYADSIKSAFAASEGFKIVSIDYSQQELRILAHLSQEENLINAYNKNLDIHKVTASRIFDVNYNEVTKDQRGIAKTVNFGLIYGQGPFGLSEQTGRTVAESKIFIEKFFTSFPKIKTYYEKLLEDGLKKGYIETIAGRRRNTNLLNSPNQMLRSMAKRELINFPIQGSAADMTKLAMINIYKNNILCEDCRMLLQVHDELVFEIKDNDNLINITKKLKEAMESAMKLDVPIVAECKVGNDWGKMEQLEL